MRNRPCIALAKSTRLYLQNSHFSVVKNSVHSKQNKTQQSFHCSDKHQLWIGGIKKTRVEEREGGQTSEKQPSEPIYGPIPKLYVPVSHLPTNYINVGLSFAKRKRMPAEVYH